MKLFTAKTLAPRHLVYNDDDILEDTDHENGALYEVKVNVNEGFIEETCRVHAAYPGLACNRAWKLVLHKHKRRLGRKDKQTVTFITEVV